MVVEEGDQIYQILHTIGNPIRRRITRALTRGKMRFSELMAACNLDYDHDAGHFNYHLSDLLAKKIVHKRGSYYILTDQGTKMAEMIDYLEKESSYLFPPRQKGGETKMTTTMVAEWAPRDKTRFKETPGGPLPSLVEEIKKKIPEGPQQDKVIKFVSSAVENPELKVLQVKEGDNLQGWAILTPGVAWNETKDKTTGKKTYSATTSLTAEYLVVGGWTKRRKEVAEILLNELLERAKEIGTDTLQFTRVEAGDSEVIQALQDQGFERISTNYTMQRTLNH